MLSLSMAFPRKVCSDRVGKADHRIDFVGRKGCENFRSSSHTVEFVVGMRSTCAFSRTALDYS